MSLSVSHREVPAERMTLAAVGTQLSEKRDSIESQRWCFELLFQYLFYFLVFLQQTAE